MKKLKLLALALCLLTLLGPHAFAQDAYTGSATGNLTVDGKAIPLHYAYAIAVDNVEEAGFMASGPTNVQVIVLSDRPLPLSSVANRDAPYSDRHSMAQIMEPLVKSTADRMYGILLQVDSVKQKVFHTNFFYPGKDSLSLSIAGEDVPDQITDLKTEGGQLSGTAFLPSPQKTGEETGPKKYQYRVTFHAPLLSEPAVTETFEGKAALTSPPVQALREYMTAAKKSDLPTLRRLTAATHQAYLKKPEVIAMLKQGDPSKLSEQVRRVVVRGDTATVMVVNEKPSYSQVSMQLTRENGVWKLYWP